MIADRLPPRPVDGFPAAVVFDMDGLMIDTERLDWLAAKAVGVAHGFDVDDDFLRRTIGRRAADIAPDFDRRYGRAMRWPEFAIAKKYWREDHMATHGIDWKPGVTELLDHLDQQRIPRAVATSTASAEARARLGPVLRRMQAAAFGDDVTHGKPAPDIYLLAAERLGVSPDRCLALEDSLHGVAAASAAGLTVIMVPDLVQPDDTIRYVCGSLLTVRDWLAPRDPV